MAKQTRIYKLVNFMFLRTNIMTGVFSYIFYRIQIRFAHMIITVSLVLHGGFFGEHYPANVLT